MSQHDDVKTVDSNGITLSYTDHGDGPVVVLAHGFPDLGRTWRLQVPALVAAGFRAIVPDMRGYGRSSRPSDVEDYRSDVVGADLLGLLDALDVARATVIGHDWGAASVWPLAFTHPERLTAVVGLSVPLVPAAPTAPMKILRERLGPNFYMVRFQQRDIPEQELRADVRRTLAKFWSGDTGNPVGEDALAGPSWLPAHEFDAYVETFEQTGFGGGLNYYRNIDANWQWSRDVLAKPSDVPALFVTGDDDLVARFMPSDRMSELFTHLEKIVVPGAGHWVHQERPEHINDLLLDFIDRHRDDRAQA